MIDRTIFDSYDYNISIPLLATCTIIRGILICRPYNVVGIPYVVGIPTTRAGTPRTPSPTETDPMSPLSCSWSPPCSWYTDYYVVGVPLTWYTKEITCRSIDRSLCRLIALSCSKKHTSSLLLPLSYIDYPL